MNDQTLSGPSLSYFSAGCPRRRVTESLTVPHLPRGEITALLKPSGSGKSASTWTMVGLGPYRGELLLEGENLLTQPFPRRAEQVVYLLQTLPAGVHLHVLGSIIVAQRATRECHSPQYQEEVMAPLRQLGIAHLAMSYLDQLSGGRKQLASLTQLLIHQPCLLLPDKPLSAFGLSYQFRTMDLIHRETRRRNIATLVVVHGINTALYHADHVPMPKASQLPDDGTPATVITPETLTAVYRVRGRIEPCSQRAWQVIIDGLVDSETWLRRGTACPSYVRRLSDRDRGSFPSLSRGPGSS